MMQRTAAGAKPADIAKAGDRAAPRRADRGGRGAFDLVFAVGASLLLWLVIAVVGGLLLL